MLVHVSKNQTRERNARLCKQLWDLENQIIVNLTIFNLNTRKLIFKLNLIQVDTKGKTIISGFSDGVVRVMTIAKAGEDQAHKKHKHDIDLDLKQVFKPHTKEVTSIAVNDKGEILATAVFLEMSINYKHVIMYHTNYLIYQMCIVDIYSVS